MSPHLGFVSDAEKELALLFDYWGDGVVHDGTAVDAFCKLLDA